MIPDVEFYMLVGYRGDNTVALKMAADQDAKERNLPEVRTYTDLKMAKTTRTRIINNAALGPAGTNPYPWTRQHYLNKGIVGVRILRVKINPVDGLVDSEWV